jgi:hypothetical protein
MCVDQPDFMRIVLLTEFLTPIFISANPGRYSKFCKGSGQSTSKGTGVYYIHILEITTDILNIVSNVVVVFALTFPFTWFSLLILHVFAAVCLKCFSAISFKTRFCYSRFLNRFCGYSCFDLLELSEASRSGWN